MKDWLDTATGTDPDWRPWEDPFIDIDIVDTTTYEYMYHITYTDMQSYCYRMEQSYYFPSDKYGPLLNLIFDSDSFHDRLNRKIWHAIWKLIKHIYWDETFASHGVEKWKEDRNGDKFMSAFFDSRVQMCRLSEEDFA